MHLKYGVQLKTI